MRTLTRILVLAMALAVPSRALAQIPRVTLPDMEIGQRIWVSNSQGMEVRGELIKLSPDTLEIATATGPRQIATADVWTIMEKDSNRNGFLIGAGVGAVSGLMTAAVEGGNATGSQGGSAAGFIAIGVAFYGGVGAWIDSAIEGRELIYRRAESSTSTFSLAPIVSLKGSKRLGVGGTITWR